MKNKKFKNVSDVNNWIVEKIAQELVRRGYDLETSEEVLEWICVDYSSLAKDIKLYFKEYYPAYIEAKKEFRIKYPTLAKNPNSPLCSICERYEPKK